MRIRIISKITGAIITTTSITAIAAETAPATTVITTLTPIMSIPMTIIITKITMRITSIRKLTPKQRQQQ